jgi:dCMP deaminase
MNWSDYLMGFAQHAARKSKDTTQVGAALVRERAVLCTGFNGPPRGVRDTPERFERPAKYLFATHAEMNLISTAAREGIRIEGCSVYVTHAPCSACARLIIQSGVKKVVTGPGQTSMPEEEYDAARAMFEEAGVQFITKER